MILTLGAVMFAILMVDMKSTFAQDKANIYRVMGSNEYRTKYTYNETNER